jgi:hypothetical protein
VFRAPGGGWLILDEVLGDGQHLADVHWHFDPAWIVTTENQATLRAVHFEARAAIWIVHDGSATSLVHGDEETGLGWFAPVYGTLVPTWTARVSRAGSTPLSIATWIAAGRAAPSLQRLAVDCDPGRNSAVAIQVAEDTGSSVTLLRPGDTAHRDTRGCGVGAYHTDARVLHYRSCDGQLQLLAACDAHHILALREGWLSVTADESLDDLCVEIRSDGIDAWSSSPAAVRLEGAVVRTAVAVRLNGRELPIDARERSDTIVARGSDWREPGRTLPCVALPASQI